MQDGQLAIKSVLCESFIAEQRTHEQLQLADAGALIFERIHIVGDRVADLTNTLDKLAGILVCILEHIAQLRAERDSALSGKLCKLREDGAECVRACIIALRSLCIVAAGAVLIRRVVDPYLHIVAAHDIEILNGIVFGRGERVGNHRMRHRIYRSKQRGARIRRDNIHRIPALKPRVIAACGRYKIAYIDLVLRAADRLYHIIGAVTGKPVLLERIAGAAVTNPAKCSGVTRRDNE